MRMNESGLQHIRCNAATHSVGVRVRVGVLQIIFCVTHPALRVSVFV